MDPQACVAIVQEAMREALWFDMVILALAVGAGWALRWLTD